ncbi:MAG: S1 RNA-binding domain-containing protein [Candidatus Nanoarchaeia archaeon]
MMHKQKGYPQEGECVFCTVTNVQYNSVFASLDEYVRKSGMIHISEISPGRIRNIRDYVKEGKVIVCKVLRINKERGHIDLSLRRVNESQRRAKVEERKQEGIAENIVKSYVKQHGGSLEKVYQLFYDTLTDSYSSIYLAFEDVVENGVDLTTKGLDKEIFEKLLPIIKDRIKPKAVSIEGELIVQSFESNGVEVVNNLMKKITQIDSEKLKCTFLGAGRFKIEITAPDYQEAEEIISKMQTILEQENSSLTTTAFKRT